MDKSIIMEILTNYFTAVDVVRVYHVETKGDVSKTDIPAAAAAAIFAKCAVPKLMSDRKTWHFRITPTAYRRATTNLFPDTTKKVDSLTEWREKFKQWQNGRNTYGFNRGNFAESHSNSFSTDHPDHNTKEPDLIENGLVYEVKSLVECQCQIPIPSEYQKYFNE